MQEIGSNLSDLWATSAKFSIAAPIRGIKSVTFSICICEMSTIRSAFDNWGLKQLCMVKVLSLQVEKKHTDSAYLNAKGNSSEGF